MGHTMVIQFWFAKRYLGRARRFHIPHFSRSESPSPPYLISLIPMKFTVRVFFWLGASFTLVSAVPVGRHPETLMRRNDGDAYGVVAVREFNFIEGGLYERHFNERDFDIFEEREVYDDLQERQVQAAIKLGEKVVEGIEKVVSIIQNQIQNDKNVRARTSGPLTDSCVIEMAGALTMNSRLC